MAIELKSSLAGAPNDGAPIDQDAIAEIFAEIALEAAVAVMAVYASDSHARRKPDKSPVCDADEYAEAIILGRLAARLPNCPSLRKKPRRTARKRSCGGTFILVDPVDGTREFLSHNGEFTINIGLIVARRRRWPASSMPRRSRQALDGRRKARFLYGRARQGAAAAEQRRHSGRPPERDGPSARKPVTCGSRDGGIPRGLPIRERRSPGPPLNFARRGRRRRRLSPFRPYDGMGTAAGDAILRAAGGIVSMATSPMRYGKAGAQFRNGPFVAWGDPAADPPKSALAPKRLGWRALCAAFTTIP